MRILKAYDNILLRNSGKQGILKPDQDGYRSMPLGAIGCFNTRREFYSAEEDVIRLFDRSSRFMDMVNRGNLLAEMEHPMPNAQEGTLNPRTGELLLDAYILRLRQFKAGNICAHIKNVRLVSNEDVKSPDVPSNAIIIMGDVKPTRDHADKLERAFVNPHENVSFSIRSLTDNQWIAGVLHKRIVEVLGFDWVTLPGIRTAHKMASPQLESDLIFTDDVIERIKNPEPSLVGLESAPIEGLTNWLSVETIPILRRASILDNW